MCVGAQGHRPAGIKPASGGSRISEGARKPFHRTAEFQSSPDAHKPFRITAMQGQHTSLTSAVFEFEPSSEWLTSAAQHQVAMWIFSVSVSS